MAKLTPKVYYLFSKLRDRYPILDRKVRCSVLDNIHIVYTNFAYECFECRKIVDKTHSRRKRIRRYIREMIEYRRYDTPCLVSLTFRDDVLESTDFNTRKRYVQDYLNALYSDWFACVDYGKKTHREHYHAIALLSSRVRFFTFKKKHKEFILPIYSLLDWPYGFYSIRPLEVDPSDLYKTLNYAFKSSSYAFKASFDSLVKPFHKRSSWVELSEDTFHF